MMILPCTLTVVICHLARTTRMARSINRSESISKSCSHLRLQPLKSQKWKKLCTAHLKGNLILGSKTPWLIIVLQCLSYLSTLSEDLISRFSAQRPSKVDCSATSALTRQILLSRGKAASPSPWTQSIYLQELKKLQDPQSTEKLKTYLTRMAPISKVEIATYI